MKYTCKAKHAYTDRWVYGYYRRVDSLYDQNGQIKTIDTKHIIYDLKGYTKHINPKTLCMYLMDDMDGKPVYENDTVEVFDFDWDEDIETKFTDKIVFINGCTYLEKRSWAAGSYNFKVTGNIHD